MPLIDPTAKQLSFQKYYHYQPFCKEHKDHLRAMLRDRRLFFSDPHTVNDPWDCKPWFDYRPMLADPAKREEMITFFRSHVPSETLNHPLRSVYEDMIRKDDSQLIKAVENSSRILADQIALRRMYCLTPFPDNTLMWSHYANNHSGICLEFDKNKLLIARARPVRYRDTYPEWTPAGVSDGPLELVLTKSKDWCYEREFRIMGSLLDGPTKLDGYFVPLPDGALTAIILGCTNEDHDEILSIVNEYAPGLAIKRAIRVPNHYKLKITDQP